MMTWGSGRRGPKARDLSLAKFRIRDTLLAILLGEARRWVVGDTVGA